MSGHNCKHCTNGYFGANTGGFYFGQDVECVNGVLIDIDVAHEGWMLDTDYPVAPCHPMWKRQKAGDQTFPNDCQERLAEWSAL